MRRHRVIVASAFGVLLLLLAGLLLPLGLKSIAVSEAQKRGLTVEIEDITVRGSRLWLHGVQAEHAHFPEVDARVEHVEVRFGLSGVRAVTLHGGRVRGRGDVREFVQRAKEWRAHRSQAGTSSAPKKSRPSLRLHGLFVDWAVSEDERYTLWGVSLDRAVDIVTVTSDLLRGEQALLGIESRSVEFEFALPGFELRRLAASATEARVNLAKLFESREGVQEDAAPSPQARGGTPADLGASDLGKSVKHPAADPGAKRSPFLSLFALRPKLGQRTREQIARWAGVVARRLPGNSEVDVEGLRLRFEGAGGLNLGPGRFLVTREEQQLEFSFLPGSEAKGALERLRLAARIPIGEGELLFEVAGGPIRLSELGVREGDLHLVDVGRSEVELYAKVNVSEDGTLAGFSSKGTLRNLSLNHPRVADAPLAGIDARWQGEGEAALDGSRLVVEKGELAIGAVSTHVTLDLTRESERAVISARLEVPLASCQEMFNSLPNALVPLLAGMKLAGTFSWKTALRLDTDRLKDATFLWRMKNNCLFKGLPEAIDPERFKVPFLRTVPGDGDVPLEVWSGPTSQAWVELPNISRHLETAVLVTEDSAFWSHQGFDQRAIESSMRQNLTAGRFVRGASTISMQLAKNLYLSREKKLSRKVQEALLTMLLEQSLRKDEMLELYFNVIEYGPGIFGIRDAARHYFKSDPANLSIGQSFYLASILPNPKAQHFTSDGRLTSGWARYLRRLMRIAFKREHLSVRELSSGLTEDVVFGVPYRPALPGEYQPADPDMEAPLEDELRPF